MKYFVLKSCTRESSQVRGERTYSRRSNFRDSNCQNSRSRFESNLRMTARVCRELKRGNKQEFVVHLRGFPFLLSFQLSKGRREGEEDREDERRVRFLDKKTLSIYPAKGITKIRILVSVRIDRNRV